MGRGRTGWRGRGRQEGSCLAADAGRSMPGIPAAAVQMQPAKPEKKARGHRTDWVM